MRKMVLSLFAAVMMLIVPLTVLETSADEWDHESLVIAKVDPDQPYYPTEIDRALPSVSRYFIENGGQLENENIQYYTAHGDLRAGITSNSIVYLMMNDDMSFSYSLEFENSNGLSPYGSGEQFHETNFFIGPESEWVTGIRSYSGIIAEDLYDGIDLVFRIDREGFKYDLVVHPGGDPSVIRMRYNGIVPDIVEGRIELETRIGKVIEEAPYTYQGDSEIDSSYEMNGKEISYSIAKYDRNKDLIIDPGVYFSTYVGSSGTDITYDVVSDDNGHVYMTGSTSSTNFPTTPGAYETSHNGNRDAFVMKLNSSGDRLLYSTFLGTSQNDDGYAIDIDSSGSAYVVGITRGTGYPTTSGSFRTTYGNNGDGFITKLSPQGNRLSYSAMIGGWSSDGAYDVLVDSSDRAVVTGFSGWFWNNWWQDQFKFPTTSGAYDTTFNGNQNTYDVFLMRIASNGGSLDFSTLIGSSADEYGYAVAVDGDGEYFVTGETSSNGYPTTSGAYDQTRNSIDGFVSKFNQYGSSLLASTFIGGSGTDKGWAIAVNSSGNPHITGETNSNNFPTTTGAYDTTYNGNTEVFISAFSDDLTALAASTYVGSSSSDYGMDIIIGEDDGIYVTGSTSSSNYPTTDNALQESRGGSSDAFLTIFEEGLGSLRYSTFLGGSSAENGEGIHLDEDGLVYIAGRTNSNDLMTSMNAFGSAYRGNTDGFCMKFYPDDFSPESLSGESGYFFVDLSWDPPATRFFDDFNIIGYRIYRGTTASNMNMVAQVGNVTTYNDTIAYFISREYNYAVTAVFDTIGESQFSNLIQATPLVTPLPNDPSPEEGDMFVNLTWAPLPSRFFSWFDITYVIYRGMTPDDLFKIGESESQTHYNDTDILPAPRTYYYGVTYLVKGVGESNMTSVVSATPNTPPGAPNQVTIVPGDTEMDIGWNTTVENGGYPVTDFIIFRGIGEGKLEEIASVQASSSLWMDKDIVPGHIYRYSVKAANVLGSSFFSPDISHMGQTVPSEPVSFTLSEGDGSILLRWEPPEFTWDTNILSYRIYDSSDVDTRELLREVSASVNEIQVIVENGISGSYSITAVNIHGEGSPTAEIHAMGRGIPGVVKYASIRSGDSMAEVSWGDFTSQVGMPVTSIKIYRGSSLETRTLVASLAPASRSFTQRDLVNGETYYFWVAGVNAMGEGPLSDPLQANPGRVPGKVEMVTVRPGLEKMTIEWDLPLDTGGREALNFNIYRGMSNWSLRKIESVGMEFRSLIDDELLPGERYVYSITMNNSFGEGPLSRPVGGTTYGRASPPEIIDHDAGSRKISLNWTEPDNDGGSPITSYRIEYKKETDISWRELTEASTQASIGGLRNGIVYNVRVLAITAIADGMPSGVVNLLVGIPPEPPSSISLSAVPNGLSVEWALRPDTDPIVLSYNIYMALEGEEFDLAGSVDKSSNEFVIDDLLDGLTYEIAITSVNIIGESQMSGNRSIRIGSPPAKIEEIWIAEEGPDKIRLEWSVPEDEGGYEIGKYIILRGSTSDNIAKIGTVTDEIFEDTSIEAGYSYFYSIIPENSIGQGPGSGIIEASTRSVPNAPTEMKKDVKNDQVTIRWKSPTYDGGSEITSYHVYRTSDDGKKELFAVLEPDTFSFTDRSVSSGSFTYSVAAVNSLGESEETTTDVEVPSRLLLLIAIFLVFLIITILIFLVAVYLPRYLRNKREREEMKKAEKLAIERQTNKQLAAGRVPGLPSAGMVHNRLGASAASLDQLPPSPQPKVEETRESSGYIRPTDSKKKKSDKKKVLRSDGKSLEEKEKEKHFTELETKRSEHSGEWEHKRKEALEKEAMNVFTGQQMEEADLEDMKKPPSMEDLNTDIAECQEMPPEPTEEILGTEPPQEEIPEWNCADIPVEEQPFDKGKDGGADADIDELEEIEELDELEDE